VISPQSLAIVVIPSVLTIKSLKLMSASGSRLVANKKAEDEAGAGVLVNTAKAIGKALGKAAAAAGGEPEAAAGVKQEPAASVKKQKLSKKNKQRLPRRQKKAQKKAQAKTPAVQP